MRLPRSTASAFLGTFGVVGIACGSFGEAPTETNAPAPSSDAGAPDSTDSTTQPGDGDAAPSCPNGALLCENFENGLGKWSFVTAAFTTAPAADHGNVLT